MGRISNEVKEALRVKAELGMLPPRVCPVCEADLSDPDVPALYGVYAPMFGLAIEVPAEDSKYALWQCPICDHRFLKHPRSVPKGKRS